MEQIVGPVSGFYVATYAWPSMDGTRFTSYAKICRRKPQDYWSAECLFKLFGGEHHVTAAGALATATLAAFEQIDDLPSLECPTFGLELPRAEAQPA